MLKFNPKNGEWEGTTGGVDVVELDRRQPKPEYKIEKSKEQKQAEIRNKILQDENYAYALRLTEYMTQQLEIKLGKSIFRNRASSCYNPETKQIWFSYENIDNSVKNGFYEYPTVGHIWVRNGYKNKSKSRRNAWIFEGGLKAVWMIAVHEMAHAVQHTKNGFWRGSIHNQNFLNELNELIILFPFEEVKNI